MNAAWSKQIIHCSNSSSIIKFYASLFKHYLKDELCDAWDWELMSQILCNLRHSGKFMIHILSEKVRRHKNK